MEKKVREKATMFRAYATALLMTVLLLCLGMGAQAATEDDRTSAYTVYKAFLEKNVSNFVPKEGDFQTLNPESYEKTSGFQVVDLDQDGVPELVTLHKTAYKGEELYIFTCRNGQVVRVDGANGTGIDVSTNAAGYYQIYVCGRGHLHTKFSGKSGFLNFDEKTAYIVRNGRFQTYLHSNITSENAGRTYKTFTIDEKEVTEETCNAEFQKCEAAGVKYLCDNTSANRASVLPAAGSSAAESGADTTSGSSSIRLNKTSVVLIKGRSCQLKLTGTSKKPKWKVVKKSIASISANGKVKAKKAGTTKVKATLNGKKYVCKVTVEDPKLNKKKLSLKVGAKSTLRLKGTSQKVEWKSSKPSVVSVTRKGVVKAKKSGTAKIVAKVGGVKFTCKVTVKKAAASAS